MITRLTDLQLDRLRRCLGVGLLGLTAAGAVTTGHAVALMEIRLWLAVLLVQGLALAAVAGVALLVATPARGLASKGHRRA